VGTEPATWSRAQWALEWTKAVSPVLAAAIAGSVAVYVAEASQRPKIDEVAIATSIAKQVAEQTPTTAQVAEVVVQIRGLIDAAENRQASRAFPIASDVFPNASPNQCVAYKLDEKTLSYDTNSAVSENGLECVEHSVHYLLPAGVEPPVRTNTSVVIPIKGWTQTRAKGIPWLIALATVLGALGALRIWRLAVYRGSTVERGALDARSNASDV
jgi:hypothetical protein